MHPIVKQARYCGVVQELLAAAEREGRLTFDESMISSDEAGLIYQCCEEGYEAARVAEALIMNRLAARKNAENAAKAIALVIDVMAAERKARPTYDEQSPAFRRDMRESGRGGLLS